VASPTLDWPKDQLAHRFRGGIAAEGGKRRPLFIPQFSSGCGTPPHRRVSHDAAPLAPSSVVGLGRVGRAPDDGREGIFAVRHGQPAGGTLENAQVMAAHESPRTTKLYDRTKERLTQHEIERIVM
jgi:hypothetical protein